MTRVADVRSYVEWDEGSAAGGRLDARVASAARRACSRSGGLAGARLGLERTGSRRRRRARPRRRAARRRVGRRERLGGDACGWSRVPRRWSITAGPASWLRRGWTRASPSARAGGSELEIKGASIAAVFTEGARRCSDAGRGGGRERAGRASGSPPSTRRRRAGAAEPGDPVFVVLSASVEGAHCELSRTIVVGDAPTVSSAAGSGRWRGRTRRRGDGRVPGTPASDLDRAARGALRGGGAGRVPHDADGPRARARRRWRRRTWAPGDETPLQAGMVISIEPGVCIPGAGGALWADNYVVTRDGSGAADRVPDRGRVGARGVAGAGGMSPRVETQRTRERTMRRGDAVRSIGGDAGLARRARAGRDRRRRRRRGPSPSRFPPSPRPSTPPSRWPGPGLPRAVPALRGPAGVPGEHDRARAGARAVVEGRSRRHVDRAQAAPEREVPRRVDARRRDGEGVDRSDQGRQPGRRLLPADAQGSAGRRPDDRPPGGHQPSVSLLYGLPKVFITGKAHLADADRGAAFFATGGNGTGPYRLTRWEKGQQIVLDHFADYWRGWTGEPCRPGHPARRPGGGHAAAPARAR